jgi:hypothetical protein
LACSAFAMPITCIHPTRGTNTKKNDEEIHLEGAMYVADSTTLIPTRNSYKWNRLLNQEKRQLQKPNPSHHDIKVNEKRKKEKHPLS